MLADDRMWERVHVPDWDSQQRLIAQAERLRSDAWAEIVDQVLAQPWRWLADHVVRPLRARGRRRADVRALAALEPRLLADIGLTRADVQALEMGRIGLDELSARRHRAHGQAKVIDFPAKPTHSPEPSPGQRAA